MSRCLVRLLLSLVQKLQCSHALGLSPVCTRRCLVRSPFVVEQKSQCSHAKGFSPVCMSRCLVRVLLLLVSYPQCSQVCRAILTTLSDKPSDTSITAVGLVSTADSTSRIQLIRAATCLAPHDTYVQLCSINCSIHERARYTLEGCVERDLTWWPACSGPQGQCSTCCSAGVRLRSARVLRDNGTAQCWLRD